MINGLNRRQVLKLAAASAVASVGPWYIKDLKAADEIKVAGIHDASGGLDIYGKPMINVVDKQKGY